MNALNAVVAVLILALCVVVVFGVREEMRWNEWAAQHCKVIGSVSPSTGYGTTITSGGKVGFGPVYVPGKTGYKCDDGMEYWR